MSSALTCSTCVLALSIYVYIFWPDHDERIGLDFVKQYGSGVHEAVVMSKSSFAKAESRCGGMIGPVWVYSQATGVR